MDYVQLTADDEKAMLGRIGVDRVEDLYANLPDSFQLTEDLNLPSARSELELQRDLAAMANANHPAGTQSCFLGAGCYDHFIPSVVDAMASKGEFVTAYTPYQAEASQGSLQAFFEFQTQVCRLTGLEVSNASLYEGATAVVEAVMMALNVTGKRRVLVAETLNLQYRHVLNTYLQDLAAELISLPCTQGLTSLQTVEAALDDDTACVVLQSPNVYGCIEDWEALFAATHERAKTLAIAVFNPIACGLLKRPGDCGADIAAAEGQPLGIPMQFGGPFLGLFAARQSLMRKMPGRLVGQTTDAQGRRGYCLTLQTREQHIRRAKATSNICTNQGLLAIRATVYLSAMGATGLQEVARQCYHKAHYLAQQIEQIAGYELAFKGSFFHEFVVQCKVPARQIIEAGRKQNILAGVACDQLGIGSDHQLLIAVTEKRTANELEALVKLFKTAT